MNSILKKLLITTFMAGGIFAAGISSQNVYAATTPTVEWQKVLDDASVVPNHIEATNDGGSIICGSRGDGYLYVLKLDAAGNKVWDKTSTIEEDAKRIRVVSDNNYIVVGNKGYVEKIDSQGNTLWSKRIGNVSEVNSMESTTDGAFIICGSINSNSKKSEGYVCKIDADGNIIFQWEIGTSGNDYGGCIQQTVDGGYILAESTFPLNSHSYFTNLIKLDRNGNVLWGKNIGDETLPTDIKVCSDGGYVITGSAGLPVGVLIKTNSIGSILWKKTTSSGALTAVQLAPDGYIAFGRTVKGNDDDDLYVLKTDFSGHYVWDYGTGEYNSDDFSIGMARTTDSGYIMVGITCPNGKNESHISLLKIK